ncbi:MAG: His/Gly/Thr/Pro-type tRNA ligase C-terminal domain-containing protein [Candidatus Binatia bacterium]
MVAVGDAALGRGFELAESLRDALPAVQVQLNLGGGSFKSQLKRADKSGAAYAVILGEEEVARGEAGLKPLRSEEDQINVPLDKLAATIGQHF